MGVFISLECVYQNITLYILNVSNLICQSYLHKAENKLYFTQHRT